MISTTQKAKLRKLVDEYREAILEAAFAGSQPPDEAQDLRATELEAKARIERYINLIAKTPGDIPSKSVVMQTVAREQGIAMFDAPTRPFSPADYIGFPSPCPLPDGWKESFTSEKD